MRVAQRAERKQKAEPDKVERAVMRAMREADKDRKLLIEQVNKKLAGDAALRDAVVNGLKSKRVKSVHGHSIKRNKAGLMISFDMDFTYEGDN